jgi:hypothetical protein
MSLKNLAWLPLAVLLLHMSCKYIRVAVDGMLSCHTWIAICRTQDCDWFSFIHANLMLMAILLIRTTRTTNIS